MEFQQLPEEVLIKIFTFCDILPLMLVSKNINNIVSNSTRLMKKIKLDVNKIHVMPKKGSKRKYQNMVISDLTVKKDTLEKIKMLGRYIKCLKINRCTVQEKDFAEILKFLPSLEEILVIDTKSMTKDELYGIPATPKLKRLRFFLSNPNFLKYLASPSLKEVRIHLKEPHAKISEVIQNAVYLHLAMPRIDLSEIVSLQNLQYLFLRLDNINFEGMRDLSVVNTSVKSIFLANSFQNQPDFFHFLQFFKSLTLLKLLSTTCNQLPVIHLRHLSSTKISLLYLINSFENSLNHLQMPNLTEFLSYNCSKLSIDDWIDFAQRNPKIEILKVRDRSICSKKFIVIAQSFRKLKQFELINNAQLIDAEIILNFICGSHFPKNIKILKFSPRSDKFNMMKEINKRRSDLPKELQIIFEC